VAVQLVDPNTVARATTPVEQPPDGTRSETASTTSTTAPLASVSPATPDTSTAPTTSEAADDDYPVWRIPCGDMINRERAITVFVDHNEVVVVGPPGESARLLGSQLNELRTALDEAAELAER